MRFIYFYTGAVNGEDAIGHYVRSMLDVSACAARTQYGGNGCEDNFDRSAAQPSSAESALANYLFGHDSPSSNGYPTATLGPTATPAATATLTATTTPSAPVKPRAAIFGGRP